VVAAVVLHARAMQLSLPPPRLAIVHGRCLSPTQRTGLPVGLLVVSERWNVHVHEGTDESSRRRVTNAVRRLV